ncbi:hypothetical protein SKP52_15755 [Sphingopyxis fribergensis]|uniref:Uncharacterized protein n=1 Tax=Sphingopyxis fribergensis TaxID=1515612 RepID=A0A0A7PLA2_9SPHN|nr:hypothetical protein [Sphingopyxis fribergensis]AJA10028.1 hypothetical protein SKP52_15755 [Sphingopyxis fribergensis]
MAKAPTKTSKEITKPEPGDSRRSAMAAAIDAAGDRPLRVAVEVECEGDNSMKVSAPHSDELGNHALLLDTFGTVSSHFTNAAMVELEWMTRSRGAGKANDPVRLNSALALIGAIDAHDELEAALALQMAGCHSLSVEMIARARQTDNNDHLQLYGNLALKLQRTFAAQIEALTRLRGGANQSVRVEHVHVHAGAQAIVGAVEAPGAGGRGNRKKRGQSDATEDFGRQPALRSTDAQGNGVPIASGSGEAKVQNARRH